MTDTRAKRDRPAKNPGGMECQRCNEIFIGEEWHEFCAICVQQVADEIAAAQRPSSGSAELAARLALIPLDQSHFGWPTIAPIRLLETERDLIVAALRTTALPSGEVTHPLSEIREWDEALAVLGIQDSDQTPADAIRERDAEIERLRAIPFSRWADIIESASLTISPKGSKELDALAAEVRAGGAAQPSGTRLMDLDGAASFVDELIGEDCNEEIRALVRKTILGAAQGQNDCGEPVAWRYQWGNDGAWDAVPDEYMLPTNREGWVIEALYASPPAALPATEEGYFPTCGRLLEDINKAAHAAGTNAWVREVLKHAHRAIRRSAPIPSTSRGCV